MIDHDSGGQKAPPTDNDRTDTPPAETGGRPQQYTDDELLSWIDAFVALNDAVPSRRDADGWPGPHGQTYIRRFGGWCEAIREAGYTPRRDA